ncbi:HAD family hydrolase [Planctomonas sp. JC2975]|uniref:HAD family hydrolase n=1 Tax=Planctomonas sp. JC2975 TaxID=2729626 RepID=UPI001474D8A1|nr:HAD family hydrolase [Planctomonas sp. JC2975]NNC12821.1 HAD family hydrolase [Planctomonas sp. JC2975]
MTASDYVADDAASRDLETEAPASRRLLIALDVDGTLLHEDGSVSDAVKDAVGRAADAGHNVTLATGRSWGTARDQLPLFGIHPEYVVCSNGAVIMQRDDTVDDGYRRAYVETFDARPVLELVRPFLPEGGYMVEKADGTRVHTEGMDSSGWQLGEAAPVPFEELAVEPASRVVVVSPSHDAEEFLGIVEQMGLHRVTYAVGWAAWLDIAPDGVSKGSAVARVRELLGIPGESLLVVGDGRNDIEMFEYARSVGGRAVAMGQAPDEVKAAAGEVTGSVEEDGLADVLLEVLAPVG